MKKKRRRHKEGSVYYVAALDRWVAEVSMEAGKRKKVYCKSKQEDLQEKNRMLRELDQDNLVIGLYRKIKEYLESWLENVYKSKLRLGTYINYKKLIGYLAADLGR